MNFIVSYLVTKSLPMVRLLPAVMKWLVRKRDKYRERLIENEEWKRKSTESEKKSVYRRTNRIEIYAQYGLSFSSVKCERKNIFECWPLHFGWKLFCSLFLLKTWYSCTAALFTLIIVSICCYRSPVWHLWLLTVHRAFFLNNTKQLFYKPYKITFGFCESFFIMKIIKKNCVGFKRNMRLYLIRGQLSLICLWLMSKQ